MFQRILVVSNLLPPQVEGGAEMVAWREIQGLRERGHDVRGLTASWPDERVGGHAEVTDASGVARIPVPPPHVRGRAFSRRPANEFAPNPWLVERFEALIGEFRPHVVHFHNLNGFSLRLFADGLLPRPTALIATFHDGWGICPLNTLTTAQGEACSGGKSWACLPCISGAHRRVRSTRRRILIPARNARVRHAFRRLDRLIFPSRHHLELYAAAGFPRDRCRHLCNPAPDLPDEPIPEARGAPDADAFELVFLGSIEPYKGIDVLLEALSRLPAGFRLVIHGPESPGRERFEAALERLGLAHRVHHAGWASRRRTSAAILAADAVVVPSLAIENCPLTVLEAMALGTPVVAADVGGIPELVRDGETGLLFRRGDIADLTERLLRLGRDREVGWRLGSAARRAARARALEVHLNGLEAIYAEARSAAGG